MIVLDENSLDCAVELIKNGELVVIPTETVYGLASNALDGKAVSKIFAAKGRPQDNPLIVHIADISEADNLVSSFPEKAEVLTEKFWPGPLTIILPKSDIVPEEVTAGLDTVAIRMPSHPLARKIISLSGVPLAAPSANRSGSPSPTSVCHVIEDMGGRVKAVVDGGNCTVGVESTVISFAQEKPRLFRPGAVTTEEIEDLIGDIEIDKAVYSKPDGAIKPSSPGMKYKHYSPRADVIMVSGSQEKYINFVKEQCGREGAYALCYDEDVPFLGARALSYGKKDDFSEQARKLFSCFRKLDSMGAEIIFARAPERTGMGLAVYNRLIRAAGFNFIDLSRRH